MIEKAMTQDTIDITELAMRSKAHWDYSEEQILSWKEDLTITETDVLEKEIYKLTFEGILVGYYSYYTVDSSTIKLDGLFVDASFVGKWYGRTLITDFLWRIKTTEAKKVTLDSDPHAQKFYEKVWFKKVTQKESSIKGRFLPIMEMEI